MHSEIRQVAPGKCPKCGMDLVPQEEGNQDSAPEHHRQDADDTEHGDHLEMTRKMREKWLWTNFTIIALGL